MLTVDQGGTYQEFGEDEDPDQPDKARIDPNQRFGGNENSDMHGGNGHDHRTCGDGAPAGGIADRQYQSYPEKGMAKRQHGDGETLGRLGRPFGNAAAIKLQPFQLK